MNPPDTASDFLTAALVSRTGSHLSGTLNAAKAMLEQHPELGRELANQSIHLAATLGDPTAVGAGLICDPANATALGGPYGWDALTHLCFSRFLRFDHARSEGFVSAATALLDAGASANTGFYEGQHQPKPEHESAIYGAAAIARNVELTRLLLARGADPNDEETPYHVPETYDNAVLQVLVESGTLNDESLTTLLLRKADWHDTEGIRYLLAHGADPNRITRWRVSALQQAVRRDNALESIVAMLDNGGDPTRPNQLTGTNAFWIAAHRGRGDLLAEFARRGFRENWRGAAALLDACARNDTAAIARIVAAEPEVKQQFTANAGAVLAAYAGTDNATGVRHLLDLGVPVTARYTSGDGYFGIPPHSLAIHVAAWRASHAALAVLLERGSPVDEPDANGNTPLMLAVRACTDSYWTRRRKPDSIRALLAAGASPAKVTLPTGYPEADALLTEAPTPNTDH